MIFNNTILGEISSNIQTGPFGSQLHQSDYSEIGIPVVMPKDLLNGKISENSIVRVPFDHVQRLNKHKIEVGDILYSRRGDVGRCAFATEYEEGWLCGTGCLRVSIDSKKADSKYVFYRLQMPETIGWVVNHAVGSTMLNLNTSILYEVPIKLPSIEEQKAVVKILSAYDDLIENNQKQIKLLEEAALRLYKEWFVDLRFPGYKNTPIVDGVPQGWREGSVGDISNFTRGKIITKKQAIMGDIPVVAGGKEPAYYHNTANTNAPVITISASGNAGFVKLYYEQIWASDCSWIDYSKTNYLIFTYTFLKFKQEDIYSMQKGACQQHIKPDDINGLTLVIPSNEILQLFEDTVFPLFKKIEAIHKQIELSKQARDRLLPKLMSGEIEVN